MRRTLNLLLISGFISLMSMNLFAQKGNIFMPDKAFEEFLKPGNLSSENIASWVIKNNGKFIPNNWIPPYDSTKFAVYRVKFTEYWFGPYTDSELDRKTQQLRSLFDEIKPQVPYDEDISVFSVDLTPGVALPSAFVTPPQNGDRIPSTLKEEAEKLNKEYQNFDLFKNKGDVIKKLQDKFNHLGGKEGKNKNGQGTDKKATDQDKNGNGPKENKAGSEKGKSEKGKKDGKGNAVKGNGMKGPFPVDFAFSKWFASIVKFLMDYLLPPGMTQLAEKIATLAYIIAPDLMNNIASTLAKLQDGLTPDSLDRVLDKITDYTLLFYNLYQDLKNLHELINDADFQKLLDEVDLDLATKKIKEAAEKALSEDFSRYSLNKIGRHLPVARCMSFTNRDFNISADCIKQEALRQGNRLLKKSGIPVLEDFDLRDIENLKEEDFKKFVERKSRDFLCRYTDRYSNECNQFFDGDYSSAVELAVSKTVEQTIGIHPQKIKRAIDSMQNHNFEEAIKHIGNKYLDQFGDYKYMVEQVLKNNSYFSENQLKEVLNGFFENTTINSLIKKQIGISPAIVKLAIESIKKKDYEEAIRKIGRRYLTKYGSYKRIVEQVLNGQLGYSQSDLKMALETYFNNVLENPEFIKPIFEGLDLVEAIIDSNNQLGENFVKNELRAMSRKLDLRVNEIETYLQNNQLDSIFEKVYEKVFEYMGITCNDAISYIKRGNIIDAWEKEIACSGNKSFSDSIQNKIEQARKKLQQEYNEIISLSKIKMSFVKLPSFYNQK